LTPVLLLMIVAMLAQSRRTFFPARLSNSPSSVGFQKHFARFPLSLSSLGF
jgi:hypothetical protein